MELVVPAVLPRSHKELREKLERFSRIPQVSRIQIDIVDGTFASPPSWPFTAPAEFAAQVASGNLLPALDRIGYELDCICIHPEEVVGRWLTAGVSRVTLHLESVPDIRETLATIKNRFGDVSANYGVALNPSTELVLLESVMDEIDYVQCMGIARIGRQGQPFEPMVLQKVRAFRSRYPNMPLQVDGGVTYEVARELVPLEVNQLVVGSALSGTKDPQQEIARLNALQSSFGV